MTDAHQEAQDAVWAARKTAADFRDIGFKQGVAVAVAALTNQATAFKAAAKGADSETRKQVFKETAALALQVAGALRKLKPGAPT